MLNAATSDIGIERPFPKSNVTNVPEDTRNGFLIVTEVRSARKMAKMDIPVHNLIEWIRRAPSLSVTERCHRCSDRACINPGVSLSTGASTSISTTVNGHGRSPVIIAMPTRNRMSSVRTAGEIAGSTDGCAKLKFFFRSASVGPRCDSCSGL
jgi:hypothetical protein